MANITFTSGQTANAVKFSAVYIPFSDIKNDNFYVLTLRPIQKDEMVVQVINNQAIIKIQQGKFTLIYLLCV